MKYSLCESIFTEAKVFCCTRLCKKCLQGHIGISELDSKVICLVCRGEVEVPDKTKPRDTWADQFRTDLFLQRLQDISQQLKEKHDCFVCRSSKKKKTEANTYCFDCDTYFCEPCNDMHLQLRGLTSHCTSALSCLKAQDIMSRRRVFCAIHKDRHIERYCKKCDALLCQDCVEESHRKCPVVPTKQIADRKREQVETLKEEFDTAIRQAEEEDELLRDRGSRQQSQVSQRVDDIENAFSRIDKAVAERKRSLLGEIEGDNVQEGLGNQNKLGQVQVLVNALKDNGALAEEMAGCASDRDIIQSADDLVRQYKTLTEFTHNSSRQALDQPVSMAQVDSFSVNTFLALLDSLGQEVTDRVVAFKICQMGLRTAEDKEVPSVKDLLMLDCNIVLVTDNNNRALKALVLRQKEGEGGPRCLRLPLKTRPLGVTLIQPNVVAVSGHQCLYIVTVTDQALSLQTTVRTRKDYWSIASLTPINIAGACKFSPSVDIVDITGQRLRTIEGDQNGISIFKQPYLTGAMAEWLKHRNSDPKVLRSRGNILVTDRQDHTLICLDKAGEIKFTYKDRSSSRKKSSGKEQQYMRGVCADQQNRIFLVDGSGVFMLSPQGKQLCQVLSGLPEPRAITIGSDNILAVSMDGRGVTFFKLCELKGPF
ncbi:hypothetical protein ACOMHN_002572 [Nucella lapillus]